VVYHNDSDFDRQAKNLECSRLKHTLLPRYKEPSSAPVMPNVTACGPYVSTKLIDPPEKKGPRREADMWRSVNRRKGCNVPCFSSKCSYTVVRFLYGTLRVSSLPRDDPPHCQIWSKPSSVICSNLNIAYLNVYAMVGSRINSARPNRAAISYV
jgi:hypothetical protein